MRDVVIVKLGSAPAHLKARRGDFEDWFARGLGIGIERCLVINPEAGDSLPQPGTYGGVVLTGSDAMLTDNPDWSARTEKWLASALAQDKPVLGICYGHQLLARTLGGRIGWSPKGEEIGTITVDLTPEGQREPLCVGLPATLTVQSSHSQAVLDLPPDATLLARNAHEAVQGFSWGSNAWGFQFHPEFDADISRAYIEDDRESLEDQGRDPDTLLQVTRDAEHGVIMLRNFLKRIRS
jgi:GMP synthase (glutamine-hydrolysing)